MADMQTRAHAGKADTEEADALFVSFEVGADTFLIPIERVVEFRTWVEPTTVPHTPPYVRGIVNIRGEIVPIYDVAARIRLTATEAGARHVVVIVRDVDGRSVGLLVDSVTDIVKTPRGAIATMPRIEGGDATSFMAGVVFVGERIIGITDVDGLVEDAFVDNRNAVSKEGVDAKK